MTKPRLGVCYYPEHWPRERWPQDAVAMVKTGISLVRVGEFAWSRIEPKRGAFDFGWLDAAIEVLANEGLEIIFGTPTATPPKWLVDEMPDMLAHDVAGRIRGFGSRRHYDFAHEGYRQECARIVEVLAKRYGDHPAIVAWQTDNEYGCHETTISYGPASRDAFRDWLSRRYQSPDALNVAWGNVFWSMEYGAFDEIELPNLTVTEPNPAHVMDFRRFASEMVADFNRLQTKLIRKHAPGRDVLHNYMGKVTDFDHYAVSRDLDVATWDSYPLGFLEQFGRDTAWKRWYLRAGDPDFQAFHHDLYRGMCPGDGEPGRWAVMEQQPGPVNWAPWNPDPHPGMVRAWGHEAVAHGAEFVSYFRWRQPPFAQERYHAGLNRPDGSPDRSLAEVTELARDLDALPDAGTQRASVALVFDYPSIWAAETQPQGQDYDAFDCVMRFYSSLRRAGQNIDVVPPSADLFAYALVVVPQLLVVPDGFAAKVADAADTRFVFGPRLGTMMGAGQLPGNLPPGGMKEVLGFDVVRVESLRPGISELASGAGTFERWFEHLELSAGEAALQTDGGRPAVWQNGRLAYLAGWPDETLCDFVLRAALETAGLDVIETGEDLRMRDRGPLRTIINYGPKPQDAGHLIGKADLLIGTREVPVGGVTVVRL